MAPANIKRLKARALAVVKDCSFICSATLFHSSIVNKNKQLSKPLVKTAPSASCGWNFDGMVILFFESIVCLYSPMNMLKKYLIFLRPTKRKHFK